MNDLPELDYSGLPYPEIRRLVYRIEMGETGPLIDGECLTAIGFYRSDISPTTNLLDAISMIPHGWWWHISHIEASVIPTTDAPGLQGLVSNGRNYDEKGRPISYKSFVFHDRSKLPGAICASILKAIYDLPMAYAVDASATTSK